MEEKARKCEKLSSNKPRISANLKIGNALMDRGKRKRTLTHDRHRGLFGPSWRQRVPFRATQGMVTS